MKDSNYFDPRDHEAFVREMDNAAYLAAVGPGMLPKGAIPKRRGMTMHQHLSSANVVASSTVPFWLPPGDGGATGLAFSGNGGDFTLSAAIIANIGTSLAGGYCYFDAGFGGSSLPAGWYWTEMSSDTAGKVYLETYATGSGQPRRPATKTTIPVDLTGRITGSTSEIIGPSGFVLPGGALGKNGSLTVVKKTCGSTTGNKNHRVRINGTQFFLGGTSASPMCEMSGVTTCVDSHTEKISGRPGGGALTGFGVSTTTYSTAQYVSVDTSIDTEISVSLQGSVNTSAPILLGFSLVATYGDGSWPD